MSQEISVTLTVGTIKVIKKNAEKKLQRFFPKNFIKKKKIITFLIKLRISEDILELFNKNLFFFEENCEEIVEGFFTKSFDEIIKRNIGNIRN